MIHLPPTEIVSMYVKKSHLQEDDDEHLKLATLLKYYFQVQCNGNLIPSVLVCNVATNMSYFTFISVEARPSTQQTSISGTRDLLNASVEKEN